MDDPVLVCACDDTFMCKRCEDSPADPAYLEREEAEPYKPTARDGSADE